MSDEELAFDLGIIADAALDTSTMTLSWFITAWVTHGSSFVSKAQCQLDQAVGRDRLPQFENRSCLTYIDAIVNEVLRWRPIAAGGIPHRTLQEDTYKGYRIPAGSIVVGSHFAITRDESVFGADVESFVPERWLLDCEEDGQTATATTSKNRHTLKSLPLTGFGFGRRLCTGRHIALNGQFIIIARLLWAFDVQLTAGEDESEVVKAGAQWGSMMEDDVGCIDAFLIRPKPFKVVFKPRGPWVRKLILEQGNPHEKVDLNGLLAGLAVDNKINEVNKQ